MGVYKFATESCELVLDLGRSTSKVAFSGDGSMIAYGMIDESPMRRSRAYVLDRRSGREFEVAQSESDYLLIPEFVGSNGLLVMVSEGSLRAFRLIRF